MSVDISLRQPDNGCWIATDEIGRDGRKRRRMPGPAADRSNTGRGPSGHRRRKAAGEKRGGVAVCWTTGRKLGTTRVGGGARLHDRPCTPPGR
jgi:hypothetical protein